MDFRVVVLASGTGSLLQAMIDDPRVGPTLVAMGSDMADARALSRARDAGMATFLVKMPQFAKRGTPERDAWDRELLASVEAYHPDLIVLAGFMKLLSAPFLAKFEGRILNSHPSLLPAFPGAHAVRDAIAAGVTSTGCTLFWVDEGVDSGAIIAQREVAVVPGDDEESLHERIKTAERELLCETVARLAREKTHD